jgi:hypothetical protein
MVIILKHVPNKISKQDIENFLTPAIVGGWLRKGGQIEKAFILLQKEERTNSVQRHVLVEVYPDFVAERIIKKLHRQSIAGKRISVCEYKIRNWHNDSRINYNYAKTPQWSKKNRRIAERRKQYQEAISELKL